MDYRESHQKEGKGRSYHKQFEDNPYRSMVWDMEQGVLDLLKKRLDGCRIRHLDFACGTGRILGHFENDSDVSVGVDVSESMLEVARERLKHSEIIKADITKDDVLDGHKFNLITAFRFFPNAQKELRSEVMSRLVEHLDEDGLLVFNNHKNYSSSLYRLARLLRRGGDTGMKMTEVKELLSESGLKIEKIYHIGVFPSTEKHLWLPRFMLGTLEKLFSSCNIFRNLALNLIFVCKRDG